MKAQSTYLDRRLSDRENEYLICLLEAYGRSPKAINKCTRIYAKRVAKRLGQYVHHWEWLNSPASVPILVKLAAESREAKEIEERVETAEQNLRRLQREQATRIRGLLAQV